MQPCESCDLQSGFLAHTREHITLDIPSFAPLHKGLPSDAVRCSRAPGLHGDRAVGHSALEGAVVWAPKGTSFSVPCQSLYRAHLPVPGSSLVPNWVLPLRPLAWSPLPVRPLLRGNKSPPPGAGAGGSEAKNKFVSLQLAFHFGPLFIKFRFSPEESFSHVGGGSQHAQHDQG